MTEPREPLVVAIESDDTSVRLSPRGEMDFRGAPAMVARAITEVARRDERGEVIVDLGGVTYCDSVGIAALVHIHRACEAAGWRLRLTQAGPQMRSLLDITGLDGWLDDSEPHSIT